MICNAQDVTTYSVYDTNQSGDLTISDVTEVVENVKKNVSAAQSKQYVTAEDLSTLFTTILNKLTSLASELASVKERLSAIEAKVGIETPKESEDDPYNGHEYVDLGLSVKWATMNVGATEVAGTKVNSHTGQLDCYGEYYAWGETTPKDSYDWSNLQYCSGTAYKGPFSKYVASSTYGTVDNKTTLELTPTCDDAARANWGGAWRMPTITEQTELHLNCYWEWTTNYNNSGVTGYIVYKVKDDSDKGKKNNLSTLSQTPTASYSLSDTHIFLPVSGGHYVSGFNEVGSQGRYWSSSLHTNETSSSYCLCFDKLFVNSSYPIGRVSGQAVRPVCP